MTPDDSKCNDVSWLLGTILDMFSALVIVADESGTVMYVDGDEELFTLLLPDGISENSTIEAIPCIGCDELDEARKTTYLRNLPRTVTSINGVTRYLSINIIYKPMDIGSFIITCMPATGRCILDDGFTTFDDHSYACKSLVEHSLQGLSIIQDDKVVFANNKYAEMTGFPIDELLGFSKQEFIDTIHPDDRPIFNERLTPLKAGDRNSVHFIFRSARKDGTFWWCDTIVSYTTFNSRPALLMVMTDITYRLNYETAIMESERKFRTLLGNLPGMAYRCLNTQEWPMEFVSEGCEELTGYLPDDLIDGKRIQYVELIVPEDRQYVWDTIQDCLEKGKRFDLRYRITTRDNAVKWVMEQGCGVFDDEKRVIALEGIIQDITHQKDTEKTLVQSERKYRELVEDIKDIIFSLDVNGTITYINPAVKEIAGYEPTEMIGRSFTDYIYPDDIGMLITAVRDSLEKQIYKPDEYRVITKSGDIRWVRSKSKPSFRNGIVDGLRGVLIDITPLKKAEEKIRKSLDEKTLLLREIHHRVKNNMQIITSLLSLQADKISNNRLKLMFNDSINRIHAMSTIHNMLYNTDNFSSINFRDYLHQITHSILLLYRMHRDIDITVDAEDVILKLDTAIPCGLIVSELVTNALKHAFPSGKGHIVIGMKHQQNDRVLISVTDNGIGLDESSLDNSTTLGIKLVQRLIRQIRGKMYTDTTHGTEVRIDFPL